MNHAGLIPVPSYPPNSWFLPIEGSSKGWRVDMGFAGVLIHLENNQSTKHDLEDVLYRLLYIARHCMEDLTDHRLDWRFERGDARLKKAASFWAKKAREIRRRMRASV